MYMIAGNEGCGVVVMGGQPLIQLNQIFNNNDTGVSFHVSKVNGAMVALIYLCIYLFL